MIYLLVLLQFVFSQNEIINQSGNNSICYDEDTELFVQFIGDAISYKWYRDGLEIKDTNVIGTNSASLQIYKARYFNSGIYHCEIEFLDNGNILNIESKPVVLFVKSNKFQVVKNKSRKVYFKGETVNFSFDINSDFDKNNEFNIIWFKRNKSKGWDYTQIYDDSLYAGTQSNSLSIRINEHFDKNIYAYAAFYSSPCNSFPGNSIHFDIEVLELNLDNKAFNSTVCEGDTFLVTFKMPDVNTDALDLTFIHNGVIIDDIKKTGENNTLIFSTPVVAGPETVGDYYFNLKYGDADTTIYAGKLSYYPKAVITDYTKSPFVIKSGQPLKLRVWAEGNIQGYNWFKDGLLIKDGIEPYYEVISSSKLDSGNYICEIINNCGNDTLNFEVNVIPIIDPLSINDIDFTIYPINIYDLFGRKLNKSELIKNQLYFIERNGKIEKIIFE